MKSIEDIIKDHPLPGDIKIELSKESETYERARNCLFTTANVYNVTVYNNTKGGEFYIKEYKEFEIFDLISKGGWGILRNDVLNGLIVNDYKDIVELQARILNYLMNGGNWNPEMMEHDNVRNLIVDIDKYFDKVNPKRN